jgi:hypothetical protein
VDTSGGTDIFGVDITYPDNLECVYDARGLSHTVEVRIGTPEDLQIARVPTLEKKRDAMEPKFHPLKCWPGPFTAMMLGDKTCEYRKNDRDFQVGDVLVLEEYCPEVPGLEMKNVGYTGRRLYVRATHIVGLMPQERTAFGIPEGYVVMSVVRITNELAHILRFGEGWE